MCANRIRHKGEKEKKEKEKEEEEKSNTATADVGMKPAVDVGAPPPMTNMRINGKMADPTGAYGAPLHTPTTVAAAVAAAAPPAGKVEKAFETNKMCV